MWKSIGFIIAVALTCLLCERGVTSSKCCWTRKLTITVDNQMVLYIDGKRQENLTNADDWTKADSVLIDCTTKLIAVKGTDLGVIAGILASTDDGYILTNASWKCTNEYEREWMEVCFDDSDWPAAFVYTTNAVTQPGPWRFVPGIRTDAYWIWTSNNTGGDLVVYCRKRLHGCNDIRRIEF